MKQTVRNPILRGFNPDPCLIRAKGRYYIVVSSFEWLPGIRVYVSDNLVNWSHETDILTHQTDLKGHPTNCSIWAPQLSYHDGLFYLVYTDVKSTQRPFKDCRNYLITSADINGPWSQPIYLNGSGFDPSLFHDEDGRKWLLNALWDYRLTTSNKSSGIVLQEYDPVKRKLTGQPKKIFDCTYLKKTEAPHVYKVGQYYYLVTAEGGTGRGHSVTIARARSVSGPYEVDPDFPMMTSSEDEDWPLQQAGHASLVETEAGEWIMAHLMTRPTAEGAVILGRETSLQKVIWNEEGWLRLAHGDKRPALEMSVEVSQETVNKTLSRRFYDAFSGDVLHKEWNTLRIPADESWASLKTRTDHLRLYGGESIQSLFDQHLIGKRQEDHHFTAETSLIYEPTHFLQMAGIALYLNTDNYIYLFVTHDEESGKLLRLMQSVDGDCTLSGDIVKLPQNEEIGLKVEMNEVTAQFYFGYGKETEWVPFGRALEASFLSGGFTGNFIALACQDMNQFNGSYADFKFFNYEGFDD